MRLPVVLAVVVPLILAGPSVAPSAPAFTHLTPGQIANPSEQVPVQFVFVGYEPAQVNQAAFLGQLSRRVDPVIRSRLWYAGRACSGPVHNEVRVTGEEEGQAPVSLHRGGPGRRRSSR